jgi:hypothetical protein
MRSRRCRTVGRRQASSSSCGRRRVADTRYESVRRAIRGNCIRSSGARRSVNAGPGGACFKFNGRSVRPEASIQHRGVASCMTCRRAAERRLPRCGHGGVFPRREGPWAQSRTGLYAHEGPQQDIGRDGPKPVVRTILPPRSERPTVPGMEVMHAERGPTWISIAARLVCPGTTGLLRRHWPR